MSVEARDRFGNPAVGADFKLILGGTTWNLVGKSGFFGACDRCALELEGFPVKFWTLHLGHRGYRKFCLDCGDFLKQL